MNNMPMMSLNVFQDRVKQLFRISNHLSAPHVTRIYSWAHHQFTKDDLYANYPASPNSSFLKLNTSLYRVTNPYSGFDERLASCFHQPSAAFTNLGRCNLPKFPVFYCSEVAEISLIETVSKQLPIADANYYISEWKVQTDREWRCLMMMWGELPDENPMKGSIEANRNFLIDVFKNDMNDVEVKEYIDFFEMQFTKDDSHIFSSFISHSFLYDEDHKYRDFIFYPSIAINRIGNNYAFDPRLINDGSLQLSKVYKIHIDYMNVQIYASTYTYRGSLVSVGTPLDETFIEWNNPDDDDIKNYNENLIRLL